MNYRDFAVFITGEPQTKFVFPLVRFIFLSLRIHSVGMRSGPTTDLWSFLHSSCIMVNFLSPIASTEGYKAGVDSQLFSPRITAEINIPGQFQVIKNDFSDLHLNQVLNYGRDGRKTSLVVSLVKKKKEGKERKRKEKKAFKIKKQQQNNERKVD